MSVSAPDALRMTSMSAALACSSAGTIPIAYELHRHTGPGPASSTILVDFGGPGVSNIARRDDPGFWFGPALETHDLLLVDSRGTGQSGAIDCPDYQHGTAPLIGNNTPDDVGQGRLLPTMSVDQYAATLAGWFGVTPGNMSTVLPNIGNYNPSTWNLGFV